jgi:hypothetical protein
LISLELSLIHQPLHLLSSCYHQVLIPLFICLTWLNKRTWKLDLRFCHWVKVKDVLQRNLLTKDRRLETGSAYKTVTCQPVGCQNLKRFRKDKMKLRCTLSTDCGLPQCPVKTSLFLFSRTVSS